MDLTPFLEPAVLVNLCLAGITGIYVWLTFKILRSQTDPYVVVYARSDELRPSLIEIVVENVGKGVARDVTFQLSRSLPWRAYGTAPDCPDVSKPMTEGPFIIGI